MTIALDSSNNVNNVPSNIISNKKNPIHSTGDGDEVSIQNTTANNNNKKAKIVIIGAGASGLQCAQHLLTLCNKNNNNNDCKILTADDIIILEARDRIGGRICTSNHNIQTMDGNNATVPVDYGAAWFHGLGYDWPTTTTTTSSNDTAVVLEGGCSGARSSNKKKDDAEGEEEGEENSTADASLSHNEEEDEMNPMIELLVMQHNHKNKSSNSESSTKNCSDTNDCNNMEVIKECLKPVCVNGNPWMRPHHVLHKTNNIAYFVNGHHIIPSSSSISDDNNDETIMQQSVNNHFEILDQVSKLIDNYFNDVDIYAADDDENHNGTVAMDMITSQSIQYGIDQVMKNSKCNNNSNNNNNNNQAKASMLVDELTPFYQYMIQCWYGAPMSQLQLGDFANDNDDEEADDDNNNTSAEKEGEEEQITPPPTKDRNDCSKKATNLNRLNYDTIYSDEGDFYGPHCTVKDGMQTILDPLIKGYYDDGGCQGFDIESRVLLNEEVVQVIRECDDASATGTGTGSGVVVKALSGMTIQAECCCIVTLPIGCLQHVLLNNNNNNNNKSNTGMQNKPIDQETKKGEEEEEIQKHPISSSSSSSLQFFVPPVSNEKAESVSYFSTGTYKKVFLTFDRIFWPIQESFIGMIRSNKTKNKNDQNQDDQQNQLPEDHILIDNLWAQDYNVPCMEVILTGNNGLWSINKSDTDIRNAVLDFMYEAITGNNNNVQQQEQNNFNCSNIDSSSLLSKFMDLSICNQDNDSGTTTTTTNNKNKNKTNNILYGWCTDCHITRWEEDPYSRGTYSCYKLGCTGEHTNHLSSPEWDHQLYFAGEHTVMDYEGSVHAALYSGKYVANQIYNQYFK